MSATNRSGPALIALKVILALFGAVVIYTALNRAFGGMATLGWQGSSTFFSVTEPAAFAVQDNHTRFLGGLWLAVGVFLLLSPLRLNAARPVLYFIFAAIFLGGLARFTSLDLATTFGPGVITSLIAELVLMPILFLWLRRTALD
ncbi:MAG TPA: DUF4345 domain-containing protein [Devosia sp.]|nr:DUF4345 domain-containing protein [Devosia sp.]